MTRHITTHPVQSRAVACDQVLYYGQTAYVLTGGQARGVFSNRFWQRRVFRDHPDTHETVDVLYARGCGGQDTVTTFVERLCRAAGCDLNA